MSLPAEAGFCPIHQRPIVRECQRCGDFGCADCFASGGPVCVRCAPRSGPPVELGGSISRWFQDPNLAVNVAIGAACMLFGWLFFPMLALVGYQLRIARRVHDDPEAPLPTWDDPGALMWDGFKAWLAMAIPVLLAELALVVVIAAGAFGIALVAGPGGRSSGGDPLAAFFALFGMLGFIAVFAVGMLLWVYLQPALHLHYLRTGSIFAGLELGKIWKIMFDRPGRYLEVFFLHLVIGMMGNFVGQLLCLVGLFATVPWAFYTQGHLLGRFWSDCDRSEGRASG